MKARYHAVSLTTGTASSSQSVQNRCSAQLNKKEYADVLLLLLHLRPYIALAILYGPIRKCLLTPTVSTVPGCRAGWSEWNPENWTSGHIPHCPFTSLCVSPPAARHRVPQSRGTKEQRLPKWLSSFPDENFILVQTTLVYCVPNGGTDIHTYHHVWITSTYIVPTVCRHCCKSFIRNDL